eukprot:3707099-Amphidinium_carterae.1
MPLWWQLQCNAIVVATSVQVGMLLHSALALFVASQCDASGGMLLHSALLWHVASQCVASGGSILSSKKAQNYKTYAWVTKKGVNI